MPRNKDIGQDGCCPSGLIMHVVTEKARPHIAVTYNHLFFTVGFPPAALITAPIVYFEDINPSNVYRIHV